MSYTILVSAAREGYVALVATGGDYGLDVDVAAFEGIRANTSIYPPTDTSSSSSWNRNRLKHLVQPLSLNSCVRSVKEGRNIIIIPHQSRSRLACNLRDYLHLAGILS